MTNFGLQAQPLIGISSWGVLAARNELANGGPQTHIDALKSGGEVDTHLQGDHNVFMLVDDGTEDKFGREVPQRSALESEMRRTLYNENANKLSAAVSGGRQCRILQSSMPIFSIQLVVEGGPVTLQLAEESIAHRQPVVVMQGSGRCADVIAYAWRYLHDRGPDAAHYSLAGLRHTIRAMGITKVQKVMEVQRSVLHVVSVSEQVYVFESKKEELGDAFHGALVSSLKLQHMDCIESQALAVYRVNQKKFYLALLFDQPSVLVLAVQQLQKSARDNKDLQRELHDDLESAFLRCLKMDQIEFVRVLAPHIDTFAFLHGNNDANLKKLLAPSPDDSQPHNTLLIQGLSKLPALGDYKVKEKERKQGRVFSLDRKLRNIDMIIPLTNVILHGLMRADQSSTTGNNDHRIHMAGFFGDPASYLDDATTTNTVSSERRAAVLSFGLSKTYRQQAYAYLDLTVWAVLNNAPELAEYMWELGGHSISVALFAGHLLTRIADSKVLKRQKKFFKSREKMKKLAARFEDLAIGVLNECYGRDSFAALQLLDMPLSWTRCFSDQRGCRNTVNLGMLAEMQRFLSTPPCLDFIDQVWHGRVPANNPQWKIGLVAVFPFAVSIIRFSDDKDHDLHTVLKRKLSPRLKWDELDNPAKLTRFSEYTSSKPSHKQQLIMFFSAPKVKVLQDIISYGTFLALTMYEAIKHKISFMEFDALTYVVILWVVMLVMEEMRQMRILGFRKWVDFYNLMDTAIYGLLIMGLLARGVGSCCLPSYQAAWYGKYLMGMSVLLMFMRLFRFYTISSEIGPKIWMVGQMLQTDVYVWFCMIAVVGIGWGSFLEIVLESGDFNKSGFADALQQVTISFCARSSAYRHFPRQTYMRALCMCV